MKSKYNSFTEWRLNDRKSYRKALILGIIPNICNMFGWETPIETKPHGYWTLELCKAEALKHKTKSKWQKGSSGSYNSARKHGWMDECTTHMTKSLKQVAGYWTLELCKAEALNYKSRNEWCISSRGSYKSANRNGWMDECCSHMVETKKPNGYWNDKKKCLKEALKYKTISEWQKHGSSSYTSALKNGWMDECTTHMYQTKKPSGYWTKERCKAEALNYKSRNEWSVGSKVSYSLAIKNGWLDECCSHMVQVNKPKGYWNDKNNCLKEALKYNSINEWVKKCKSTYSIICRKEWFNECIAHMVKPKNKPCGFWSKEECIKDALKYKTKTEWRKSGSSSYQISLKNGWYAECSTHMIDGRLKKCKNIY